MPPQNRYVVNHEARRGSTSAVGHHRALPSTFANRSQSLDELETNEPHENIFAASEGSPDETTATDNSDKKHQIIEKPPARPHRGDRAKSADPLGTHREHHLNDSETNSIGSSTSLANAVNAKPSPNNQDDAKSGSTACSQSDSISSQTRERKNSNLLNRYVKKVRSLMKK